MSTEGVRSLRVFQGLSGPEHPQPHLSWGPDPAMGPADTIQDFLDSFKKVFYLMVPVYSKIIFIFIFLNKIGQRQKNFLSYGSNADAMRTRINYHEGN